MLSQDEKRKLKKNAALYARMPVQLQIDTSNQHYSQIQNQKALIIFCLLYTSPSPRDCS